MYYAYRARLERTGGDGRFVFPPHRYSCAAVSAIVTPAQSVLSALLSVHASARKSTYFSSKVNFDAHLQRSGDSTYLEFPRSSLETIWTYTTPRITQSQVTVVTQMSHCDPNARHRDRVPSRDASGERCRVPKPSMGFRKKVELPKYPDFATCSRAETTVINASGARTVLWC